MPGFPAFFGSRAKIKYQKYLRSNDTLVTFNSPIKPTHGEYEDAHRNRKGNFMF